MPIVEPSGGGSGGSQPFSFASVRMATDGVQDDTPIAFDTILSDVDGYWQTDEFAPPVGKGGMFAVSASILLLPGVGPIDTATGRFVTGGDYPNVTFPIPVTSDGDTYRGTGYALMQLRDGETVDVSVTASVTPTLLGGANGSYFAIARLGDLPA